MPTTLHVPRAQKSQGRIAVLDMLDTPARFTEIYEALDTGV